MEKFKIFDEKGNLVAKPSQLIWLWEVISTALPDMDLYTFERFLLRGAHFECPECHSLILPSIDDKGNAICPKCFAILP